MQQRAVLRIYATYRLLLASILLISFVLATKSSILGSTEPRLFSLTATAYLVFALLNLVRHYTQREHCNETQLFFEFFIDVGCVMLMSYCSASSESGLSLLLVVTVSAASMTMPAQLCLSIASLASIAAIAEVAANTLNQRVETQRFVVAGLVGVAYFTTAIVIRYLSARIAKTEQLADIRGSDIETLSQINKRIVQRMQTGIVVMQPDGRIRLFNAAAAELLDIPYQESPTDLYAPLPLRELGDDQQRTSKIVSLKKNKADIQANITRLDLGEEDSEYLIYLENISKISQRAQNMKLASLGRFSASIAHEIRNPLSAISHAAQLLSESPELGSADKRFASIILNQAARMNGIIKNILELSRGTLPKPQRFLLGTWLEEFIADWKGAEACKIELINEAQGCEVNVDPSQLRQVIANITENGVRHGTGADSRAELKFHIHAAPGAETIILDLIDSGPGIAAEDEDKIFEPFFTTKTTGNGLGLYLSRELCLANQIHIFYRRTDSGESCFRLQFPHPDRGSLLSET